MKDFKEGDDVFTIDGVEAKYLAKTKDGKHIVEISYIQQEDYIEIDCGGGYAGCGCEAKIEWQKVCKIVDVVFDSPPIKQHNKEIDELIKKKKDLERDIYKLNGRESVLKNMISSKEKEIEREEYCLNKVKEKKEEQIKELQGLTNDVKKFTQLFFKYASLGEVKLDKQGNKIPSHLIDGAIKNMDLLTVAIAGEDVKLIPLGLPNNLPKKEDYYTKSVMSFWAGGLTTILEAKTKFLFLSAEDEIYSVDVFIQKRHLDHDDFIVYPNQEGESIIRKQIIENNLSEVL